MQLELLMRLTLIKRILRGKLQKDRYSDNKIYEKQHIVMTIYVDIIKVHTCHGNDKHENQDSFTPGEWKVNGIKEGHGRLQL